MSQAPCAGSGAGFTKQTSRNPPSQSKRSHPGCSGGGNRRGEDTGGKMSGSSRAGCEELVCELFKPPETTRCVERCDAGVARFESVKFALSRSANMRERRCPREILTTSPQRSVPPFAVRMQNEAYPTALKSTVIRHLMTGGRAAKTTQLHRSQHSPSPVACETDAGTTGGTRRC